MGELIRIVVKGVQGIGMANELYSLCHTNPPKELPRILSCNEAAKADARALGGDWIASCLDIEKAYNEEEMKIHG